MTLFLLNRFKLNKRRKIPLRLVLAGPFVLQISLTVGLIGWLSLQNGQKAVSYAANQLRREITTQIEQHLNTYLEAPHIINQMNSEALRISPLSLQDPSTLHRHFLQQLQAFTTVDAIGMGNQQGGFLIAERDRDGSYRLRQTDNFRAGNLKLYATDSSGDVNTLLASSTKFDARSRPWYLTALQTGQPTWGPIFTDLETQDLGISAVRPLFDETGLLQGVLVSDLLISSTINQFFSKLGMSPSTKIFIIERSGLLVADSISEALSRINPEGKVQRFSASDSQDFLIRLAAQHLQKKFTDFNQIQSRYQFEFMAKGKRQFLEVSPFQDRRGLDWLIVVILPETDFMRDVQENTLITIIVGFLALIVALGVGIVTSGWISQQILRLVTASQAITNGNLNHTVSGEGVEELETLAQSFNQMTQKLQQTFATLEEVQLELETRVEQRTAELKETKRKADIASLAKSQFIANMSHELRTPLNGILGYAQILQRTKIGDSQLKQGLGIIYKCGSHLLTLINDILDLSKAENQELQETDFHFSAFLLKIVEVGQFQAEQKGIAFSYQPATTLPYNILADEKRLRQLLINLLSNAIKFTETGSVIFKVYPMENPVVTDGSEGRSDGKTSSPTSSEPDLTDTLQLSPVRIRFQIEDTGSGIGPEQINKIFLPFEQVSNTSNYSEGTGLGLAISQKIAQMMNSTIQVTSQPGIGSIFWVDLDFQRPPILTPVQPSLNLAKDRENSLGLQPLSNAEPTLVAPPPLEIETLYDLAMKGHLQGIIKQADKLEKMDDKYIPFANQLRQLSRGFQEKMLKEFISQYR